MFITSPRLFKRPELWPVQRIAVPMIGGMISSTLLTLVVIPAVYGLVKGWQLQRAAVSPPNTVGRIEALPLAAE